MKYQGEFTKSIMIEQYRGGYMLTQLSSLGGEKEILRSFKAVVRELARRFELMDAGERIIISSTYDVTEITPEQKSEDEG